MTILDAVRAVPHEPDCGAAVSLEEGAYPCDCDRDERIAKGIEAALTEAGRFIGESSVKNEAVEWNLKLTPEAVRAFAYVALASDVGPVREAAVAGFVRAAAL